MGVVQVLQSISDFLKRILGFVEVREISPGESYDSGRFYSIYALDGNCVFDATVSKGDNLTNVTLQQDAAIQGTFESISVDSSSSGSALIYVT